MTGGKAASPASFWIGFEFDRDALESGVIAPAAFDEALSTLCPPLATDHSTWMFVPWGIHRRFRTRIESYESDLDVIDGTDNRAWS